MIIHSEKPAGAWGSSWGQHDFSFCTAYTGHKNSHWLFGQKPEKVTPRGGKNVNQNGKPTAPVSLCWVGFLLSARPSRLTISFR